MKKALITIAAALLLAGCGEQSPQKQQKEKVHFFHAEFEGHTYVVGERYGGLHVASYVMSIMHDPDCLCHHKENE